MARRTTSTSARPPDDEAEAARQARIADLAARVARRAPEDFPPVSDAVRDKLALILHPGRGYDDPPK